MTKSTIQVSVDAKDLWKLLLKTRLRLSGCTIQLEIDMDEEQVIDIDMMRG